MRRSSPVRAVLEVQVVRGRDLLVQAEQHLEVKPRRRREARRSAIDLCRRVEFAKTEKSDVSLNKCSETMGLSH